MFGTHICSDYRPIPSHKPFQGRSAFKGLAVLIFSSVLLSFFFLFRYSATIESNEQGFQPLMVFPASQTLIDKLNAEGKGLATYGRMTPVTYQQIEEAAALLKEEAQLKTAPPGNNGDSMSQVWYDPSNPEHNSKSRRRLSELGVDMEEAKRNFDWSNLDGHDFRSFGPVRDQGRTGTCWAFSATLVAEHAWWLAGNDKIELAPQLLADCLALECQGDYCNEENTAAITSDRTKDVKACFNGDCHFQQFDNFGYCDSAPFPNKGCGVRNGWGGGAPLDAFRYYWHKGFVSAEDYPFRSCAPHDWEYRHRDLSQKERKNICLNQARYCSWDDSMTYPFSKCILGLPVSLPCRDDVADNPVGKISGSFLVSESFTPQELAEEAANGERPIFFHGEKPAEPMSEERMRDALLNVGPLSISIASNALHYYQGGILDLPDELCQRNDEGDHAVTIVGYGEENGVKYWKIQNSWGDLWGEHGFVRVARGKNVCGVATSVQTAYV